MLGDLLKTITVYFSANLLAKIINFLFFAWMSRMLTIEEMGEFSLMNMAVTIISLLMLMEIPSGFNRYYLEQSILERDLFTNSVVNFLLIFDFVMALILTCAYYVWPCWFDILPNDICALGFVLLIPFCNAVVNIYQSKMRLLQRVRIVSWMMLIQSVGYIVSFFLLREMEFSKLESLMGAFVGQNLFVILLCFRELRVWRPVISWKCISECMQFSFWLVPSSVGAYFSLLSGKFFLGRMNMIREIGIYEGNNKVANTFQLIMEPIYMAVQPMYFARYREKGYRRFYIHTLAIISLLLAAIMVITSLFSGEITYLILGGGYVEYHKYLCFFVGLSIFQFLSRIIATNIHLAKKSQYDTAIEIVCGIVNSVVCFFVLMIAGGGLFEVVVVITICYGMRLCIYCIVANHCFPETAVSLIYGQVFIAVGIGIQFFNSLLHGSYIVLRILICVLELAALYYIGRRYVDFDFFKLRKCN